MRKYGEGITHDLLAIDGVQSAEQTIGRASGGEDTWGTETQRVPRRAETQAVRARTRTAIQEAGPQDRWTAYPGLQTEVLTFLGDRIGESLSGETAALAVGVYGADLDTLDKTAAQIAAVMEKVPAPSTSRSRPRPSTPVVRVDLDLPAMARYGLSPAEVLDAVQTAYQGSVAAQVYQESRGARHRRDHHARHRARTPRPWATC